MKKQKICRLCQGQEFKKVINFGKNPLVNSLIEKEDLDKTESVYPLIVEQCQQCFLVQIVNPIDSGKIYRDQDYLYYSGDMPKLREYFAYYANDLSYRFLNKDDLVIEIGSNDGLMLEMINTKKLGVDPSTNVVVRALAKGIRTISDFFSHRLSKSIVTEFGKAKLIYGNNCIAHIDNLHDIMKGVKELLTNDGVFVVECNYWGGMVKNKNYSLIYHDHFSYFTLKNWIDLAEKFGMKVFDAIVTPAQGGSLRVFMSNDREETVTTRLAELDSQEKHSNLNSYKTAQQYSRAVKREAKKLKKMIVDLKNRGFKIAGYGAAAKGFSVLKLAEIDQTHIDYFVDDSPAKQDKYTPVTHISVISRQEAQDKLPDYFFITAPNYESVIIEKETKFKENGGKFITCDSRII